MNLVVVLLVIAVVALWLRQLRFERRVRIDLERIREDQGDTYYA